MKKISIRAIAALLLVSVISLFALASCGGNNDMIEYGVDLSSYMYLAEEDYSSITVDAVARPTESDVEYKIAKLLYNRRDNTPSNKKYVTDVAISAGDDAYIYYRGYIPGEGGKKDYFDGGCNFATALPRQLGIGSAGFVGLFEYNLIGKTPEDYATIKKRGTNSVIEADDVIKITYSITMPDGQTIYNKEALVDLSDENVDEKWGEGFTAAVIGVSVGTELGADFDHKVTVTVKDSTGADVQASVANIKVAGIGVKQNDIIAITYDVINYDGTSTKNVTAAVDLSGNDVDEKWGKGFKAAVLNATVGEALDEIFLISKTNEYGNKETSSISAVKIDRVIDIVDDKPTLTIDVTFPVDYGSAELAAKAVKFDVYIMYTQCYDTPEFDEKFIKDTLKVTESSLSDYEGDTLVEKYKAKLLADAVAEWEDDISTLVENAMWDKYIEKADFITLPGGAYREQYDLLKGEVEYYYDYYVRNKSTLDSYYGYYCDSIDDFGIIYLGLGTGENWLDAIHEEAELAVKKQLVLYYVAYESGYILSGDAFDAEYDKYYAKEEAAYIANNVDPADYNTTAEYENKVEEAKQTFANQYGEDYFNESVRYNYAIEMIKENYVTLNFA